jgi:crossover junction endodeoxyribonuclease RuvC
LKNHKKLSRVLAIDPGFDRLGVAILEAGKLLHSECIVTKPKEAREKRLLAIGERLREIIKKFEPSALAIETLFFNQNVTTAIGVAEARGVVLYEAGAAGLKVFEYSPQAVKIAVTGYGKADKLQIESMVRKLVSVPSKKLKMLDDELDAIALGITCIATEKYI